MALESQGYQVEKENKAFEQIKDSVATFQTFLTIFLYGMLIAGAGALILVLSLWLRERVYESGDSTRTWKRQEFNLPTILFRSSVGISWSFASSICCRKCHHILFTPNRTSQWRSGNLTRHTSQSKWSINQSPILCRILCLSAPDWLLSSSPLFRISI